MAFEVVDRRTQYAVIGMGIFGSHVATTLSEAGAQVIAVDRDPVMIEKLKDKPLYTVSLDSTNEDALRSGGIDNVDCAIVCIGMDMIASILTTLLLKQMKIPRVIARAITYEHSEILKLIGVKDIIQPELETADKLAKKLIGQSGFLLSYEQIWKNHAIVEIKVTPAIVGKTLSELDFRRKHKVNVIAIKHIVEKLDDEYRDVLDYEVNEVPDPNKPLMENDVLIIVGYMERVNKLKDLLLGKTK